MDAGSIKLIPGMLMAALAELSGTSPERVYRPRVMPMVVAGRRRTYKGWMRENDRKRNRYSRGR